MKTSSKYRRLIRQRKLRRQRSAAFMIVLVVVIAIASVAFANQNHTDREVVSITVCPGDTVWSIAREYKPDDMSLEEFVYEISSNNGIKDGNIVCGQSLYIPVEF